MSFLDTARQIRSGARDFRQISRDLNRMLESTVALYHIKDLDTLLEQVLFEARLFVTADAGTLYLKRHNRLYFSYLQNDSLFDKGDASNRYIYSSTSLSVDRGSLAGYVAATGDSLLIDDVYDIKSEVSYSFNPGYDEKSSYRTRSMLIVPLLTRSSTILGVLQLINAKDENNDVIPFSVQDRLYVTHFANEAANAIEQAKLNREMVLRMVEISELRDPFETSQHAKRVGAYSVELYEKWALAHDIPETEIKAMREILRTAAMLHDVGKVAISDTILRKEGDLADDERDRMRLHTVFGARLFRTTDTAWDKMAAEVVLNHHENWDGTGYPGAVENIFAKSIRFGPGKRGTQIPLAARVVKVVDVFDSLVSKRAYKEPWEQSDVVDYLQWQAGKQFDPELVEMFLNMMDVVHSIRKKYSYSRQV